MKSIFARYPHCERVRLSIAEGGVYERPTAVSTVLGSCVAVTFHCPQEKIGATFHAVFPYWSNHKQSAVNTNPYKFVDSAIITILRLLFEKGVSRDNITAKVFGGASGQFRGQMVPGEVNVNAAFEVLSAERIHVDASDIGGVHGRNIIFITSTGEVFVKHHKGLPSQWTR